MLLNFGLYYTAFFHAGNNSLANDAFQSFCDINKVAAVTADCLGNDDGGGVDGNLSSPEVNCPCCTSCCNDNDVSSKSSGSICEIKLPQVCQLGLNRWLNYHNDQGNDRGTTCVCSEDGSSFTCLEESCLSCNLDGSVCAKSVNVTFKFDKIDGAASYFSNTWKYVKFDSDATKLNSSITLVNQVDEFDAPFADIIVESSSSSSQQQQQIEEEEVCSNTNQIECLDGSDYFGTDCRNVESMKNAGGDTGYGTVEFCSDSSTKTDDFGLLTVVKLQDANFLGEGSCPPLFWGLESI